MRDHRPQRPPGKNEHPSPATGRAIRAIARLVLLLALGMATTTSATVPPATDWQRLDTPHFSFLSDASPAVLERLAIDLETLHQAFSELQPGGARPVPQTTIFAFRNDASFTPFKSLDNSGRPARIKGYYLEQPFGAYLAINGDPRSEPRETLLHEYLHGFVENSLPGMPLWVNEGLAEFYSTFRVRPDGVAEIGQPDHDWVEVLRRSELLPLETMLDADRHSDLYRGGSHSDGERRLFYAQSWLMMHWVLAGEVDRQFQLAAYLNEVEQGSSTLDAFETAFELDWRTFDIELEDYVRVGRFRFFERPTERSATDGFTWQRPPRDDVLTALGFLLTFQRGSRSTEARELFEAALGFDFTNPHAIAGLGLLAERSGNQDDALSRYRDAARKAPAEPTIQFLLGQLLVRDTARLAEASPGTYLADDPGLLEGRRALQLAVRGEPELAQAWAALGLSWMFAEPADERGLEALGRAWELAPGDTAVLHHLAVLSARLDRYQEARSWTEGYQARIAEPEVLRRTRKAVALTMLKRGVALGRPPDQNAVADLHDPVADERLETAVTVIQLALAGVPDLDLRDELRPEASRIQVALEHDRLSERYRAAVTAANGGERRAANAELRDVLERIDELEDDHGGQTPLDVLEGLTEAVREAVEATNR